MKTCLAAQYENHVRAVLGIPLSSADLKVPSAIMLNILRRSSSMNDLSLLLTSALSVPGASIHLYKNPESRAGRKIGYIIIVGSPDFEARSWLRPFLQHWMTQASTHAPRCLALRTLPPNPLLGIIISSDSDLAVMITGDPR